VVISYTISLGVTKFLLPLLSERFCLLFAARTIPCALILIAFLVTMVHSRADRCIT